MNWFLMNQQLQQLVDDSDDKLFRNIRYD